MAGVSTPPSPQPQQQQSILITFDGEHAGHSHINFAKRLADLRSRYPMWRVRGIVHGSDLHLVPEPPAQVRGAAATDPVAPPDDVDADNADAPAKPRTSQSPQQQQQRRHAPSRDSCSGGSSSSSEGNVVGQAPRVVRVGMHVRLQTEPFVGRTAVVLAVRSHGLRFHVALDDGSNGHDGGNGHDAAASTRWWCTPDDVVVVAATPGAAAAPEVAIRPAAVLPLSVAGASAEADAVRVAALLAENEALRAEVTELRRRLAVAQHRPHR